MSFIDSPLESLSDFDDVGGNKTNKNSTGTKPDGSKQESGSGTNSKDTTNSGFTPGPKSGFVMPERPNYYKSVSKTVDVRHLMRKFGMQAGFHLPFSTAENKTLLEQLEAQQIKVLQLRAEIEESRSAIKELKSHALQSAIDIRFTQGLVDAKTLQRDREANTDIIETQAHQKRKRQLVVFGSDLLEYNERNRVRLIDLENRKDKMKALQEKVMSDKKRLEIWKELSGKTESFLKLIIGHKAHDDRHAWELENKQTDLGALNKELRMELGAAAMNTSKLSEQYARLSIEYRKEYKERKEMVSMWSATLAAMKKKDMDVKGISKEFCEIRGKLRSVEMSVQEQEKVVQEQEWSVRQTEFDQNVLDRKVGELRERVMHEKEALIVLKNECIMNKVVIQQTTIATQGLEAAFRKTSARVKHFKEKAKALLAVLEVLKARCADVSKGKSVVDNYLGDMEEELRQEEKRYQANNREAEKMRKFNWERNNDKTSLEEEIVRTETRQSRLKSSITLLQIKEYDSMEQLAKKQSKMYRLDLEISSIETRMTRILDDSVNPEYFKLQQRLVALRDMEVETSNERNFILKEVHAVKEFAYRYTKEIEVYTKKQNALRAMVDNINHEANRMQGVLDSLKDDKKNLTIQMSLDKINFKRLDDAYKLNRGKVLSIAQRRATMEWAVLERKSEIKFATRMLLKQRKELRGHTAKRKLAISNIVNFCEKLKGRFELTTRLMAPDDGVSGEEAMTFQIRNIARERETLSVEQKKWEHRLTEANKEAEGLTNVVLIMKNSNDSFRNNLAVASKSSVEAREVDKAMKNQKKSIVIRNRCNKTAAILRVTIDNLQKQIDVTKQEAEDMLHIVDQKDREGSSKSIEHNRLRDRIHRWNNLLHRKTHQLKGKVPPELLRDATNDLKVQMIQMKFQKALEQLDLTITDYPIIKGDAFAFLEENNLMNAFVKAQKTRLGTVSSRTMSSVSTSRSSVLPRASASRLRHQERLHKPRPSVNFSSARRMTTHASDSHVPIPRSRPTTPTPKRKGSQDHKNNKGKVPKIFISNAK